MLPNFIVIGAMKTGTTSLHHYLGQHPEIGMSHTKELDFFKTETTFNKGLDWYTSQFPSGNRILGESSPNYSKCHLFPGVPERMHSVLPDISLIYVVRHPVDRAVSHYLHQLYAGREERSIAEAFQDLEQNPYVQTGAYMFQLNQFLKFYPPESILIIDSTELMNNRADTLSHVFKFLGVDDNFFSENFSNIRHKSSSKRQSKFIDKVLPRLPGASLIPARLLGTLRNTVGKKVERPEPTAELKARLLEHYSEEIESFEQFSGKIFHAWHTPPISDTQSDI